MMTGISFLREGGRKCVCLGRSRALGRVGGWGNLSSRTGIPSWQHPSRTCGPFSMGDIFSQTSYDPGEAAVGLQGLKK